MAGISVRHVNKSYLLPDGQEKVALQGINPEIKDGEFVCLLGPSGCGKTTLLNILSGLDKSYEGTVQFFGEEQIPIANVQRQLVMSYMFQESRLLPWLSVRENIRFVLDDRRSEGQDQHIDRWLSRVGLDGYAEYYPMQLSTGMRQRVAVARALILEPDILFMDEPFGSLDELTATRMREELLELWQEQQCTVVFVTHNSLEAVFLADRLVIMSPSPGRITTEIPVKGLIARPREADDRDVWELSRQAVRQLRGVERNSPDQQRGANI